MVSGDFVTVHGKTHCIVDLERPRRGSRQTQAVGLSKPTTALRVWSWSGFGSLKGEQQVVGPWICRCVPTGAFRGSAVTDRRCCVTGAPAVVLGLLRSSIWSRGTEWTRQQRRKERRWSKRLSRSSGDLHLLRIKMTFSELRCFDLHRPRIEMIFRLGVSLYWFAVFFSL